MISPRQLLRALGLSAALTAWAAPAAQAAIDDPLDHPAAAATNLAARPMLAAAQAGARLLAVGSRGVVIYSDDAGRSWRQSQVPVQSDLVAVHFPTPAQGWAVGHDGVVLHSGDGGRSWVKQFDGRLALQRFEQHYRALGDTASLAMVKKNYGGGPTLPILDVWFKDASTGYAVGSFGTLIATRDGGKTWEPWFERLDNPEMLNLNAVRAIDGQLFVAAERGIVFKFDAASGRFRKIETGYGGSLFGVIGSGRLLLAYGLRGAAYRSTDGGEHWEPVTMPSTATISAGLHDAASGAFLLVNVAGELLVGDATASRFELRKGRAGARYSGIGAIAKQHYLVTGMGGVQTLTAP
ncbi:MAG TPA: YCF48-related protein [Methylibium sp.]|nr:YCF48-related protein [Methylibium sp.]